MGLTDQCSPTDPQNYNVTHKTPETTDYGKLEPTIWDSRPAPFLDFRPTAESQTQSPQRCQIVSESTVESPFDDVRWTTLDREGFIDLYWSRVAPRLRTDGYDPETHKPTHQWFRDRGLRGFLAALRRHHDRSFGEFWSDDLELGTDESGYDWDTDDTATIDALDGFVASRRSRHDLTESSLSAKRRRLNLYARAYRRANSTDDLLSPVARDADSPTYEAVDACYAAFDWLNEQGYSARTKMRVRGVVDSWYQHLVGRRLAATNPASGLYDEFKWKPERSDPSRLDADHVRRLVKTAGDPRERLLVVALAGWGLRANEVAALHVSQLVRDGEEDVPYLTFEERKNGPGEVNVLYGLSTLDARIDELASRDDWAGYLFPSKQGADPHVTRERVWTWFRDLAERAELPAKIDGEQPSPQLCRRFWYDTYTSVLGAVLDGLEEIAAEQGSDDPQVVMTNYLSDERARRVRREFMRTELAAAFESEAS